MTTVGRAANSFMPTQPEVKVELVGFTITEATEADTLVMAVHTATKVRFRG